MINERHETGYSIESAWAWSILYFSNLPAMSLYIGEIPRKVEPEDPHVQITCIETSPASSSVEDKIEVCTVEITVRVSRFKSSAWGNPAVERNIYMGAIRKMLFDDDLSIWLEAGMLTRGSIMTVTEEPLVIYNPLYDSENISYIDDSTDLHHARTLRVQSTVGPTT